MPEITLPLAVQCTFAEQQTPREEREFDTLQRYDDDDVTGFSQDDRLFLSKVVVGTCITDQGNIELPIPFKDHCPRLPDNSIAVYQRTKFTFNKLKLNDKFF